MDWSFEATNLIIGKAVPVVTDGGASSTDIEVVLLKDEIPNASIQITFPEAPEDTIYEVVATATFRDTLGNEGEVQHRVWSYVLAAEDSDALVEALLTTAAVVAGISPDDLTAASNLEGVDPSLRQDQRLQLLHGQAWQKARPQVCAALGKGTDSAQEITQVAKQLDQLYRQVAKRFAGNKGVSIKKEGVYERISMHRPSKVPESPQLKELK